MRVMSWSRTHLSGSVLVSLVALFVNGYMIYDLSILFNIRSQAL